MSENAFDSLIELSDLACFQVDSERRLVHWSAAAEHMTGFAAREVLGLPCVVGVRCEACLSGCGVFDHGEVRDVRLVLHHKDGTAVPVRKSGRTLRDADGHITGAIEVVVREPLASDGPARGLEHFARALGRHWLMADAAFRVVEASADLGPALGILPHRLREMPLQDLLGVELFGPSSAFRAAIAQGGRREGWRADLTLADGRTQPVSVSAGCFEPGPGSRASVFVMLRPERDPDVEAADIPMFEGIVGRSAPMQRIFRLIDLLHDNDATVLVSGPSGSGKELVARALHARSNRAKGPFVAVNCGALPADLLESELFGHVRGAFTGAVRDRQGRFELAQGGTLFLDEIGDLPLPLQVKLLRVLQEHTFERVGDARPVHVDVRVIAATHVDLPRAVAQRLFREDLYYRLRVVPIDVPPLRERREDLELLIQYLLLGIGRRRGRALRLSPGAMRRLLDHDWPGNVRELENALEFATAVCEGQTVQEADLPAEVGRERIVMAAPAVSPTAQRPAQESAEAARIEAALVQHHYQREAAALALGMSRSTLWRKMKQLRLG